MIYDFSDEFLLALSSLKSDGRLNVISVWFKDFAQHEKEEILHISPAPDDANFDTRLHFRRGIASFADVLNNVCADPDAILQQRAAERETERLTNLRLKAINKDE